MNRTKLVVTGGAGFIGANLVRGLNAQGFDDIVIVDHLGENPIKWKNLLGVKFTDYLDRDEFLSALRWGQFKDVRAIFHLGACSDTTVKDVDYLYRVNFLYTKELCLFALKHGIRFIYASSAATYGDGSPGFSDEESLIPALRPLNPYGFSKQLFDLWAYQKGYLNKVVGLKYFNVFGEYEFHKGDMRSVVLKAYEQIKSVGFVKLFKSYHPAYPDGGQLRDFIYVQDAVSVTLFFLEHPQVNGIFNVGTGKARSFNDLVLAVFKALGLEPKIEYIDMPERLRPQYQYFTQAEMKKLRQAGYTKTMTELEEAVKQYVKFLELHYHWFLG